MRIPFLAKLMAGIMSLALLSTAIAKPPNIVLILADDLGQETLGCYGGDSYRTPHIDALASSGTRFLHCYSMPVCHPTRICLLTGRYPFRIRDSEWGTFPSELEKATFAHTLGAAGYATAIAGKWQLTMLQDDTEHPHRLGFDDYCLFGWHEGPRYYQPRVWQNGRLRNDVEHSYGPDVYCEFLIDFIERNRERPFMAFYSMALCHDVTDDLDAPVPVGPQGRYDSYLEMVEGMDERVGRLVAALDRLGLRENTLIVFTGDNGTPKRYISHVENGELVRTAIISRRGGEDVRGGKGELTDAGTNVPLIANWQGTVPTGQVVNDLVDFSDFFATFRELAEAELPSTGSLDGKSFAGRLIENQASRRNWAYAEHGGQYWVRT